MSGKSSGPGLLDVEAGCVEEGEGRWRSSTGRAVCVSVTDEYGEQLLTVWKWHAGWG
ncbi:hypothetical protein [Streptomyces sp. NPDC048737]|uniref:hypothetical protein n=1 Tax=unclassified Streptomyces TaxID=2593676 RepID=UPI00343EA9E1